MSSGCDGYWWTWSGSNRRPLPCHGSALPAAPQAHRKDYPILMEWGAFVNETEVRTPALPCVNDGGSTAPWQPRAAKMHRPGHMFFPRLSLALLTAALPWSVSAQNAAPAGDPTISVSGTLRPALGQVSQTLSSLNIKH